MAKRQSLSWSLSLHKPLLPLFLLLLLLLLSSLLTVNSAAVLGAGEALGYVPCDDLTTNCEALLGQGSTCIRDSTKDVMMCSNPFASGCLHRMFPDKYPPRVCNSNDPPEVYGVVCRQDDFRYMEIRIFTQNWESVYFESWILQIILSELLGVPTTLESGTVEANMNLYEPYSRYIHGKANEWGALQRAHSLGDCTLATSNNEKYQSCAHLIPEVWIDHRAAVQENVDRGVLEHPQALGALGQNGWFMPKFTAQRYPQLLSSFGLAHNRELLARIFKRPTTWHDYCQEVHPTNCNVSDDTALRPPMTLQEQSKFFVEGLYQGYFRYTDKNNCTAHPTTCTGHIGDYPCGWGSHIHPQTYHLNIALSSDGTEASDGYLYEELQQIWKAANATKSDVVMMYFFPEALYQKFQGTDAEFTRITLPPPTQACVNARTNADIRCASNETAKYGSPLGTCDDAADILRKVISSRVYADTHADNIPLGLQSPAYAMLDLFTITSLEIAELFDTWHSNATTSNSPREAACQWVSNNLPYVQQFVPRGYPRVLQEPPPEGFIKLYLPLILGPLATIGIFVSGFLVYVKRRSRVMITSQVEFLWILLAGLLCISVGAWLLLFPPTQPICIASVWFINVGYTLELVPLNVKVAAINHVMRAAKRFRRVKLARESLFQAVCGIMALMVIFLVCWTAIDPPHPQPEYFLDNEDDSHVVSVYYSCASNSEVWRWMAAASFGIMLFSASVLAFQMRKLRQDFNESQILALLIYGHFFLLLFRIMIMAKLEDILIDASLARVTSSLYSLDILATLGLYFVPKFLAKPDDGRSNSVFFSNATGGVGGYGSANNIPPIPNMPPSQQLFHSTNSSLASGTRLIAAQRPQHLSSTSNEDARSNDEEGRGSSRHLNHHDAMVPPASANSPLCSSCSRRLSVANREAAIDSSKEDDHVAVGMEAAQPQNNP